MIDDIKNQLRIPYMETSAKTRLNVDGVFHELVKIIRYGYGAFVSAGLHATFDSDFERERQIKEKKSVNPNHGRKRKLCCCVL
jgi:hypothetical protein